ncbi:MAG: hypothetical protein LC808_41260, partial [Actinobacteria bacterium]|nr:hypothetical protein [Actinomycetota bacterium]
LVAHVLGVVLAAVVIIALLAPDQVGSPLGLMVPLLLIASVALIGYVTHLRSAYPQAFTQNQRYTPRADVANQKIEHDERQGLPSEHPDNQSEADPVNEQRRCKRPLDTLTRLNDMWLAPRVRRYPWVRPLTLLVLGLVAVLWATSLYAYQAGTDYAVDFVADLPNHSAIVLYSAERIAIAGPGVQVADISQSGTKYHYQYSGLRLLARSVDTYLLLPRYWKRGQDRVFIIRDDGSIRIDVAAQ